MGRAALLRIAAGKQIVEIEEIRNQVALIIGVPECDRVIRSNLVIALGNVLRVIGGFADSGALHTCHFYTWPGSRNRCSTQVCPPPPGTQTAQSSKIISDARITGGNALQRSKTCGHQEPSGFLP